MKSIVCLLLCLAVAAFAQPSLNNESIVKMTKAGLGEDVIISSIKSQLGLYQLGADDLIALKKAGVSDKIITAMIDKSNLGVNGGSAAGSAGQTAPDPAPASSTGTTPPPAATSPAVDSNPAPAPSGAPVPLSGSKIFIAPMENGLDGFITAEIIKQRLPLNIVTEESMSDFVMAGASQKQDDHWYNTVFGGKDKNEGNVRILNGRTKQMVWAGEAGDRSMWFGGLKRGGQRKVAERIVAKLKKDLSSNLR